MRRIIVSTFLISMVFVLGGAGCVTFGPGNNGSGSLGMFVSSDKGENWQSISRLSTAEGLKDISSVSVYRLFEDPTDRKGMYWASRESGLFFTYDEGRSWRRPIGQLTGGFVYSVAVHPKIRCTIYATDGNKVYRTEDCSRSWTEMYRESRIDTKVTSLSFNMHAPHEIYLSESNGDLLKSGDKGVSWSVVKRFETYVSSVSFDPFEEGILYVVTKDSGMFRSENGGTTWKSLGDKLAEFPKANEYRRHLINPKKEGEIYWISTYGILVSYDRGDSWKAIDLITPPGSALIYGFAVNTNDDKEIYYTATIGGRSTFYKTSDGGKNWITRKLPSGQLPTALLVHRDNGNIIYLGYSQLPQQ